MTRSPLLLAYCHGYRAAHLSHGVAFMPMVMSEIQRGEWLKGFNDAVDDMLVRVQPDPRVEPDVVRAIEAAKG